MTFTFTGTKEEVENAIKRERMNNAKVEILNDYCNEDLNYRSAVVEMTPYSIDAMQEITIYGDPDHEAYLLSSDYDHDCQNDQWAWLENE
jgi:hypothetical protein